MTKKPRILITNDDGVFAPGIKHLWESLSEIAEVIVVAPAVEQSAASLSITIRHPLYVEQVAWHSEKGPAWSVSGTPSDCVKLAISAIMPELPQLIVSGINHGNNAGRNIHYSGTVAAVVEGILRNIPGIAFSLDDFAPHRVAAIPKELIQKIVLYALQHPLPQSTFLNVNFPQAIEEIKGIRMARQGLEYWIENPEQRSHPAAKRPYYWMGAKLAQFEEHEESEINWLQKGYVTAVPIYMGDLTHLKHMDAHKNIFETFVN
jgi:5'-nucleotidase